MSSFEASFNTIRNRFAVSVASAESLSTGYDNDNTFVQPESGKWARVSIQTIDSDLREIGQTKRTRNTGILFVQLFDDLGLGDKGLLALADIIVPLFRNIIVSGVTFQTPSVVRVGQSNKWYQINVHCPFHFDDIV